MILRLLAVALFDLPQAVILPGLDVVRIGFQRALVPDLRDLVVAELAVGVADQVGNRGAVVMAERLELLDRRAVIVAVVDRRIGRAIRIRKSRVAPRGVFAGFLFLLGIRRRRRIVVRGGPGVHGRRDHRHRKHCQRQKSDRKFAHAYLVLPDGNDPTPGLAELNPRPAKTFRFLRNRAFTELSSGWGRFPNSICPANALRVLSKLVSKGGYKVRISARRTAMVMFPLMLAACAGEGPRSM